MQDYLRDVLPQEDLPDPGGGAAESPGPRLTGAELSAAPASGQPSPLVDPKGRDDPPEAWLNAKPSSNSDYASLIIQGGSYGFATFGPTALPELQALQAGAVYTMDKTITGNGTVKETGKKLDGSREKLYTMLAISWSLIQHKAARWVANPGRTNATKEPYYLGWLARDQPGPEAHSEGEAVDVNGRETYTVRGATRAKDWIKWDGKGSGGQVLQMLNDLPEGDYEIGLPFNQYPGFPAELHLANQEEIGLANARASNTPLVKGAVRVVGTVTYQPNLWAATYNPSKGNYPWDDADTGRPVTDKIMDPALRAALVSGLPGKRFTKIFPDNPNHIHIKLLSSKTMPAGGKRAEAEAPTTADAEV